MSTTTEAQGSAPAGRKRGPRPKPVQAARQMSLADVIAAAKLGEKRGARLGDYRTLAAIHGEQPFALVHGVAAVDALASGAGIAMNRENVMDLIHEEVMAMDEDLRALGVTAPDPSLHVAEDQGPRLDAAA